MPFEFFKVFKKTSVTPFFSELTGKDLEYQTVTLFLDEDEYQKIIKQIYIEEEKISLQNLIPKYLILSLKSYEIFAAKNMQIRGNCEISEIMGLQIIVNPLMSEPFLVLCDASTEFFYHEVIHKT